jgi:hypothetical protein
MVVCYSYTDHTRIEDTWASAPSAVHRCVIVLGRMRSGWELSEGSAVVHLDVLKVISSSNLVRASGVGGYIGQDWIRFIDYSTFVCCCE